MAPYHSNGRVIVPDKDGRTWVHGAVVLVFVDIVGNGKNNAEQQIINNCAGATGV
jgi:hypothetical protein